MATPFIGEIRMFGFNFPPQGWHLCDGSLLSIAEYDTLYALLGTTYGGDGQVTFGVPDFRGRIPVHQGQGLGLSQYVLGELTGTENVTLTLQQIPSHTHSVAVSNNGTRTTAAANNFLASGEDDIYTLDTTSALVGLTGVVSPSGSSLPHMNIQPNLCVNFCIALEGIFPSRN
jgi:microcystin-dependent protein